MKIKGTNANLIVNGIDLGKVNFQIIDDPQNEVRIGPHVFEKSFGEKYISFLRMIEENPQDSTTKLIMCDFLEENNQIELRNAWLEIIETNRIPADYEKYASEDPEIFGLAWFFCDANAILDKTNKSCFHHVFDKYQKFMTGKLLRIHSIMDYNELHFYKNDFIYAYHDYAQAIVKYNETGRRRIQQQIQDEIDAASIAMGAFDYSKRFFRM